MDELRGRKGFPALMGIDVGYHSPTPRYEGQTFMKCNILPGGQCYYDGSGLRAEEWFKIFLEEGDAKIWQLLEQQYNELFNNIEE